MISFSVNSLVPTVFPIFVANNVLFIRYQIMLKCWEENPSDRPTFTKLKDMMKEIERNHRVSMGYNWREVTFYRVFLICVYVLEG